MIWQPLTRDVDPLVVLLSTAVRSSILEQPNGTRENPPWRDYQADGVVLRTCLRIAPQQTLSHNGRASLAYRVVGDAVSGEMGYRCEGRAILDLKTRAFLDVDCQLVPVGHARTAGAALR